MPVITRGESWLLAAATAVLAAGVVAAVAGDLGDESTPPGALPSGVPTPGPSATPSLTPSPTPTALAVSGVRISTYSRGSHELVVRAVVSSGGSAVVRVGDRSYPLQLVDGEATGRVPVSCAGPVPELTLVVVQADGTAVSRPLGRPADAFAQACGAPQPAGPTPTGTRRGS